MKFTTRLFAFTVFAAGIASLPTTAWAAKGQDFPGTTCTCKNCGTNGGDVSGKCENVCKDKTVYSKGSEPYDYCKAKALTASGANLRAAMALGNLNAVTLGKVSGVSPATINRLLASRTKDMAAMDKVTRGLERSGVAISEDGVRLIEKSR